MYDVVIVGGGPAGSTCARTLVARGAKVAVIDRAEFPRVKLCAGWLSPAIWDVLEVSPASYPRGIWEWHTAHVHYRGADHAIPCHGWFIRRYEFDDYLLRTCGAELRLGTQVKSIERDSSGRGWRVGDLVARHVVGAGGTHCPVARMLAPERPRRAVGVQELELQTSATAVARTRLGGDGEPELLLFDDVGGYGWNVPKSDWINVGCGTLDATAVRGAWQKTHAHLHGAGHLPSEAEPELAHLKGHSYYLFDPVHLEGAERDGVLIAGDALGLAHPITAEGILPATVSGRLAAEAILDGDTRSYPARLRAHPVLADYRRVHKLVEAAKAVKSKLPAGSGRSSKLGKRAVARGFAWMFSGARLPAPRLLDFVLERR